MPPLVGVLGGLGPLASAAFLQTIYALPPQRREQERPRVLLLSDPAIPDRTDELLRGDRRGLRDGLERGLRALSASGASRLVICCVTMHAVLPDIAEDLRQSVHSLIDLAIDAISRRPGRYLLLCSTGARDMQLFERHPCWPTIASRVVLPDADDQAATHALIYRLKAGDDIDTVGRALLPVIDRYGVDGYVAGCTELHLVNRRHGPLGQASCIDPLIAAARLLQD